MIARLFYSVTFLLIPFISFAHSYWIELEGSHRVNEPVTVKLYYGEHSAGERMSGKHLDKMKDIKVYVRQENGEQQEIIMQQTNDFWTGNFTPALNATYVVTGINDTRDVQDWTIHNLGITRPIQYLKAYYTINEQIKEFETDLPLNISIEQRRKGDFEVTVKMNGKLVPSQSILISSFGNEANELITKANGKATITLDNPGLYILSVDWIDKTPGTFRDKKYETVRYRLDYSFYN